MRILIELPTWLGDAVMSTPAIINIIKYFNGNCKIILFGSYVSTTALKNFPNIDMVIVDESKKSGIRFYNLYKIAKSLGYVDYVFSFRKSSASKIFRFFIDSDKNFGYKRFQQKQIHQVIRYNDFINNALDVEYEASSLKLYYTPYKYKKKTLGINAGATYGSAKRWYPSKFAQVSSYYANEYDIVIFGSDTEVNMALEIEQELRKIGIVNIYNKAGKTSIEELLSLIGGLDLFITNDSGPMHVAAAYLVPTVSIFGPTKFKETSQWSNPNSKLIRVDMECAPCMKRVCPLGHHNCMKMISVDMVIEAIDDIIKKIDN